MLCIADILLFYTKKLMQYREYCTSQIVDKLA